MEISCENSLFGIVACESMSLTFFEKNHIALNDREISPSQKNDKYFPCILWFLS